MEQASNIRYLEHEEINKELWDRRISTAPNGVIYAYSWYLDQMSAGWSALVSGDYEYLMPLPWKKKFGIHYLYQPFLTAQLGLFGSNLSPSLLKTFLDNIPKKFRLWEFSLNHDNVFEIPGHQIFKRSNYILDLSSSYEALYKNFRENIKRNVKKSEQYGSYLRAGIPIAEVLQIVEEQNLSVEKKDLDNFSRLYTFLESKKMANTYAIYSKKDKLLSSAAFVFSHGRAYYILVGNHPNGRTLGASHALINAFIRDHAGKKILLDFEGSDIRNLAFFYSSFGAREENFAAIRLNRLPWYMKLFKK
jgi:hypothetical protein